MNVTIRDHPQPAPDIAKTATRPTLFELRHYPTEGVLQELAYMLIRPPRFIYNPQMLRPPRKAGQRFTLETFRIPFELTFYRQQNMRYVILYLHGNGSSSFEGTLFLPSLPDGVGLACFDFKGCGNREGEFITLGQEESAQVDVAARFLQAQGHRVVGWGRSMGAVSLLLSSECSLLVADSAYADLALLCKESSVHFVPRSCCCLFHCLFPCVFACIQSKVHSLAGLEIKQMDVAGRLKAIQGRQICFIHGEEDSLVPSHHAQHLYDSFSGPKMLVLFEGTHNSSRPEEVLAKCFEFIEEGLRERQRGKEGRVNSKIVEMSDLQKQAISKIATSKPTATILATLDSSEQQAIRRDASDYATVRSETSRPKPIREEYCESGVPVNFRDVLEGEELQRREERSESSSQAARRARMSELIFAKRKL